MDLVSTTEEVNTERIAPENEQSVKDSPSVDVMSEKKQKRRERSFAKHKRMSLWASTAQSEGPLVPKQKPLFRGHKSMGRIIESVQARFSDSLAFLDEETAADQDNIVDIETSEHLLEEEHLTHIFGYLTETEILCTASLVSTTWADAATAASVQRMIASVGHTEQEDDDGDIGEDEDTSLALVEKSASFPSMDRSWSYLNTMFPWGCFLSEGAFKKVFKVHNSTTGQAEALSLM